MKKVISIFLIIILALAAMLPVTADDLKDFQAKKNQVDKQLSNIQKMKKEALKEKESLQKDINYLKSQLDKESTEYNSLMNELQLSEQQLAQVSEELAQSEAKLSEQQKLCEERLRAMYKNSKKPKLSVFLECDSILDVFETMKRIKVISRKDKKLLEELSIDKDEVEVKLQMQQQLIQDLQQSMNTTKKRLESLKTSRSSTEKALQETKKEISEWEKQEDKLLKESQEIQNQIKSRMSKSPYTQGKMLWPVPSATSYGSGFGMRLHPILKVKRMHTGIDIGAKKGESIVAANDGKVIISGWTNGYGYRVVIDHGGGISTLYAHCSKILVKEGQVVKRGDKIALIGSTGLSTGPHLHFEVRENGEPVNPINSKYLNK